MAGTMTKEVRIRVGQSGRIVIPAAFRRALGIAVGDQVVVRLQDGELRITTKRQRILRAQARAGRYIKPGVSVVDELLAERRREAERE